jgi:hypothetical protein
METPLLFGFKGEELVQLANIGCGAVCVLGVVISGFMIFTLTGETGKVRGPLIRSFMKMCVLLAFVAGISSSALAWQNAQRVAVAEQKTAQVKQGAEQLLSQVQASQESVAAIQTSYQGLETKLVALKLPPDQSQNLIKDMRDKSIILQKNRSALEHAAHEARAAIER